MSESTEPPKAPIEDISPRVLGRWRDSFFGTRTLVLNADHTAQMILDLDFAGQLLFGPRLEFDMKWSTDGPKITIEVLDGRPAKAAQSAMKTWGARYEYELTRVHENQIEMKSPDGTTNYTLHRLPDESSLVPQ